MKYEFIGRENDTVNRTKARFAYTLSKYVDIPHTYYVDNIFAVLW